MSLFSDTNYNPYKEPEVLLDIKVGDFVSFPFYEWKSHELMTSQVTSVGKTKFGFTHQKSTFLREQRVVKQVFTEETNPELFL